MTIPIAAADHCSPLNATTLEGFLDGLLDEDLDTLAELPGTPAQVLCSQFTYYAKSNVILRECLARDATAFDRLLTATMRLPNKSRLKGSP